MTHLNKQLQEDYGTVFRACMDLQNGGNVNVVTAAIAALDLYDGLRATYPAQFKALAERDIEGLRRISPETLRGVR